MNFKGISLLVLSLVGLSASALRVEPIKYGDFSQWITRNINESKVPTQNKDADPQSRR